MAVVQYNPWNGGGIIAVNYEARSKGVKRGMRGGHAKQLCPDIKLCSVPSVREKADLGRYRDAGREVVNVMCQFTDCVQRASIDEAYIDLTKLVEDRLARQTPPVAASAVPNTFVVGYTDQSSSDEAERAAGTTSWLEDVYSPALDDISLKKLAVGAAIVEEMRRAIVDVTGFKCSAGIAHNKILAKLVAGFHKPNKQTVIPHQSVAQMFATLPLFKVRNLGGKLGRELEDVHGAQTMGDLLKFSKAELVKLCDQRMGNWLYDIARGYDNEPVSPRLTSKSIACCKNFPGPMSLARGKDVEDWLNKLTQELLERLCEDESLNQRRAQQMVVSARMQLVEKGSDVGASKSVAISSYNHERIVDSARACLKKLCAHDPSTDTWAAKITFLGLSAGKFVDTNGTLKQMFNSMGKSRSERRVTETVVNVPSDPAESRNIDIVREAVEEDSSVAVVDLPSVNEVVDDLVLPSSLPEEHHSAPTACSRLRRLSSLDESAGPSFFERMLLDQPTHESPLASDNVPVNGEDHDEIIEDEVVSGPAVAGPQPSPPPTTRNLPDLRSRAPPLRSGGKMSKPTQKAVTSFFTKRTTSLVDPLEIFPDLDAVDESTLALLPPAYRRRVMELKNSSVEAASREVEELPTTSSSLSEAAPLSPSCPTCQKASWPTQEAYDSHRDYHFALRLHRQLNPGSTDSAPRSLPPPSATQHKRKSPLKRCKLPAAKKSKSIEVFFRKST